jgi:hypothetical protein
MRTVLIGLTAFLYLAPSIARAEQHMFLVANDADGYGIDRCLASGEKCGAAAANAYCTNQAFTAAARSQKILPAPVSQVPAKSSLLSAYVECSSQDVMSCGRQPNRVLDQGP